MQEKNINSIVDAKAIDNKINMLTTFQIFVWLVFVYMTEKSDLPATRLIAWVLVTMLLNTYHKTKTNLIQFETNQQNGEVTKQDKNMSSMAEKNAEHNVSQLISLPEYIQAGLLSFVEDDIKATRLFTLELASIAYRTCNKATTNYRQLRKKFGLFAQQKDAVTIEDEYKKLIAEKKADESKINKLTTFQAFTWLAFLYMTEKGDLPTTRLFCLIFAGMIYNTYSTTKTNLRHYVAAKRFRLSAQKNNVEDLKSFIKILGVEALNMTGAETNKNALHFAVSAGSLEAVMFLVEAQRSADQCYFGLLPNIINHQDRLGNTPVHYAIQAIISNKNKNLEKAYQILLGLLKDPDPNAKQENPFFPNPNSKVSVTIKNKQDKNAYQLIDDVKDKTDPRYGQVNLMIKSLYKATMDKQEKMSEEQTIKKTL